jgi:3-dehydroquinate synthase
LLHGEAIAVGMVAATTISLEKGLVDESALNRLVSLLTAFGLPVTAPFDPATVREKMMRDKKKSAGTQQWVLPVATGGVEIRTDVTEGHINRALAKVHEK